MSSCLLPQFNCPPDNFSFHSRPLQLQLRLHHLHLHLQGKDLVSPTHCALSTTSSSSAAAVFHSDKLRLSSSEATHSNSVLPSKPWTYVGAVKDEAFQATSAAETLLPNDGVVVSAAAAEAIALAKAAVKVAKDAAALMVNNHDSLKTDTNTYSVEHAIVESDSLEPTPQELPLLDEHLSEDIAVRSTRQSERKVRRARAAKRINVSTSSPTIRRKRRTIRQVDLSDPLRYLRRTASTLKLLTAAEESECSQGIQDLLKLERLQEELAERYGEPPTFAQWAAAAGVDQKTLRKQLHSGTLCKDKMVLSNIRLVIAIAKKFKGAGMNLQDLVQEGCKGLIKAAEKFDASKGWRFSTYAHLCIKQTVRRSLCEQTRLIRLPLQLVEASYKVREAKRRLYNENGKEPDDEQVAEAAGISMKRLKAVLKAPKYIMSLDQTVAVDMNLKHSEVMADPNAETAEEILMKQLMKRDLEEALGSLKPKESHVIRLRFGLDDGRMKTLQEVGHLSGVTRECIRQIEATAFQKLKSKNRTKQLMQYVVS